MLFAVKNHVAASLLLLLVLVVGAWPGHDLLGIDWRWELGSSEAGQLAAAVGLIALSDGGGHGLLALIFGQSYLARYRALVEFFAPQGLAARLAGSLLAGGEELIFRGLLLEGLQASLGWAAALALSSLAFGLCHLLPRRDLWPFAVWAVWEGVLLGAAYLWTGSLAVSVCLHVLHDLAGFSAFAWQRRTGWLLG
jgi:membrane protease YdiL (CAAX protease family)